MPVLIWMAAGALIGGGIGGGRYLSEKARRQAAQDLARQDVTAKATLLRAQIDYEELRRKAIDLGVDPDVVERGYEALLNGEVTQDQAEAELRRALAA